MASTEAYVVDANLHMSSRNVYFLQYTLLKYCCE